MLGSENRLMRRDWMKLTAGGLLGASAAPWFDVLASAAAEPSKKPKKSCILLWMTGDPSQVDTFDMKPGTPSAGEFKPIDTKVPGVQYGELLPKLAKQADKLTLLRSMSTGEADHHRATYYMRTGYRIQAGTAHPAFGSVASAELGDPESDLPNFIWIGGRFTGSGYLGAAHNPFVLGADVTKPPENIKPGLNPAAFDRGFNTLQKLEQAFLARQQGAAVVEAHRSTYQQAAKVMRSNRLKAFDLAAEPKNVRQLYSESKFGNACLLARRLVEVGVPFIGVCMDADWDTHTDNWNRLRPNLTQLDSGWSGLIEDLHQRGLLESTLVVWMGEFGRSPAISKGDKPGRDHYARAWTTVLAGGGIKAGQVIGRTNKLGTEVEERPISTADYMATLCTVLGIDFTKKFTTPDGRPIRIAGEGAKVVENLI